MEIPAGLLEDIEQTQKELSGICKNHQRYMKRRAEKGVQTSTDALYQRYIEQLKKSVDLLETIKALFFSANEEEENAQEEQQKR